MKLGLFVSLTGQPEEDLQRAGELGFPTCQLGCWSRELLTDEVAKRVADTSIRLKIELTALWCGWEGPAAWDLADGPATIGLLPEAYRHDRLQMLLRGSDFAATIGVPNLVTHVGFIPEDPNVHAYRSLVATVRYLATYCAKNGQAFLFETGQETPVTLLRMIEDVGLENVGVNLDAANLIMYGKGNPVDALDVLGKYVRGIHAKDAVYPTSGRQLGREVPLGTGRLNLPAFVARLKDLGYDGPLTIEREISGEQQISDVRAAKELLERLIH